MSADGDQDVLRNWVQKHFRRLAGPELPNMLESREKTREYLGHPEPSCRCAALWLMEGHWQREEGFAKICEDMALSDPDIQVRGVAIGCLASTSKGTNDLETGRMLAELVKDRSVDIRLREAAYRGLFLFRGVAVYEWPPVTGFDLLRDANWQFVNSFLP